MKAVFSLTAASAASLSLCMVVKADAEDCGWLKSKHVAQPAVIAPLAHSSRGQAQSYAWMAARHGILHA